MGAFTILRAADLVQFMGGTVLYWYYLLLRGTIRKKFVVSNPLRMDMCEGNHGI